MHGTDQRAACARASLSLARFILPSCSQLLSPLVTRSWSSLWALFAWQFTGPGFSSLSNQPSLVDTVFLCPLPWLKPHWRLTGAPALYTSPASSVQSSSEGMESRDGNWTCSFSPTFEPFALCSPLKCRYPLTRVLDLPLFLVDSQSGARFLLALVLFLISLGLSSTFLPLVVTLLQSSDHLSCWPVTISVRLSHYNSKAGPEGVNLLLKPASPGMLVFSAVA